MATCPQACAYSSPTVTQATCFYPSARLVTKRFLNHSVPSFCNILQQIKHPLLGMFSICFMLILIKEFETEQTVPSRWPYKCEISKLFYLLQTPLVNFFKLIQASESLLIPRRKLSNPSLQIFAFFTAPGANDVWCPPWLYPHPPCLPGPSLALHWPNPFTQNKAGVPTPLGSMARASVRGQVPRGKLQALSLLSTITSQPATPLPTLPLELGPSYQSLPAPQEE